MKKEVSTRAETINDRRPYFAINCCAIHLYTAMHGSQQPEKMHFLNLLPQLPKLCFMTSLKLSNPCVVTFATFAFHSDPVDVALFPSHDRGGLPCNTHYAV